MRFALTLVSLAPLLCGSLSAQAALSSDLWRVAAGTRVVPPAIAEDGLAPLWTPAALLPSAAPGLRLGVETIHAPEEIGVTGSFLAAALRLGRLGTLSLGYGRLELEDIVATETSPEASGGTIPVFATMVSLGLARSIAPHTSLGVAARVLEGRLAHLDDSRVGVDFGAIYSDARHLRAGVATRLFDPLFGHGEDGANYHAGLQYTSAQFHGLGTEAALVARYGATLLHGEAPQHLLSGGLQFGNTLAVDLGAQHEAVSGEAVWRSQLAIGIGAGRYRIQMGRDGGVNGFGATYRFSLTADFR